MQFEYLQQITAQESIDIDDIGNTAIQCWSNYGETKVLIIKTMDGITEIIEFGPVNTDINELPDKVIYNYQRFEFNQGKIIKIINKFINDEIVSQVREVTFTEAKNVIKNLVDCMMNKPEEEQIDFDKLI